MTANFGAPSRLPSATFAPDGSGTPVRLEAEAFSGVGTAGNFIAKDLASASGGRTVLLKANGQGNVTTALGAGAGTPGAAVTPGWYQVRIVYIDETDGNSSASVKLNGALVGAWDFDGLSGTQVTPGAKTGTGNQLGNYRTITFETPVKVEAGAILSVAAARNAAELARIDYIELIPVAAPNAAPTDIALTGGSVAENAAGATVGTLSTVDPDAGDTHTYTVDDSRFEVVGSNLRLKAGVALDREAAASVNVAVTATDAGGKTYTETFAVAVTNVNEAPQSITLNGAAVQENAPGAAIGTLNGNDPDVGDSVTFTVNDSRFRITGNTLQLKPGAALNFEATPTVTVSVTATDAAGLARTQDVTFAVGNVNEAPTQVLLSNATIAENSVASVVGTLSTVDPDAGGSFTYTVDDTRFEVVGTQLKLKNGVALDYETTPAVALAVTSTDQGGLTRTESLSVVVANLNEAPTGITLSGATVFENAAGAVIGTLGANDPDAVGSHGFTVDDTRFTVVGNSLRLQAGVALDFESTPSVTVNVTATDQGGLTFTQAFVLGVQNVNEAPVFTAGPTSPTIFENTSAVSTYTAADPDAGAAAPIYGIVGGADAALFTIDTNGALAFRSAPDFEAPRDANGDNVYLVTIGASDGTLSSSRDVAVTVNNVRENNVAYRIQAESFTPTGTRSFAIENVANASGGQVLSLAVGRTGTAIVNPTGFGVVAGNYTISVGYIDETDGAVPATLRVDGVLIGDWTFDGVRGVQLNPGQNTGTGTQLGNYRVITFTTPFAVTGSSVITLGATQNAAESARIDYVELRPVERPNAAPTDLALLSDRVAENAPGATIGRLAVTDPDAGSTHTFAVNDSRFEVVDGGLRLKAGVALDREATPTIDVAVTATDDGGLSLTKILTVQVGDVNEAPTAILLSGTRRVTDEQAGAVVGTLTTTDPDAGDTASYAVNDSRFEVVGGQLKLKNGVALDFPAVSAVQVTVTATDGGGLTKSQAFTIGVNAPPTDLDLAGPRTIQENVAGAVIGAITVVDANAADAHVFTTSDDRFEVAGGNLKLKNGASLDFEAGNSVTVAVTATDPGGLGYTESFTVGVGNVNEAATSIGITFANGAGLTENERRVTVGTLNNNDQDAGDRFTYAVQDTRFAVEGNTLKLVSNFFDFETQPVFRLTVTVTDQAGASFTQQVPIPILDVNEAPTITSGPATVTLREGFTAVATYGGTDQDAGSSLSYFIVGGQVDDAALFTIDAATGALSFRAAPDFETPRDVNVDNVYRLTVGVTDGTFTTGTQAIKVYVGDVQEAGTGTLYSTKINFQPASSAIPEGYFADTGKAYNAADGYGWVTEASVADGTANGTIPDAINVYGNENVAAMNERGTAGVDPRLTSYAHFEFPLAPQSSARSWAWEHALANGTYIVRVAVGDTTGQLDSDYHLNIEGAQFIEPFIPTATFRTTIATGIVTVTDGKLTIDSIGGDNTEIQYLEIEQLADQTPGDGRPVEADYSSFLDAVSTVGGEPARALNHATNINPNASFAVDVNIVFSGDGPDGRTINPNTVHVYETLTGKEVLGVANTSAGFDTIVFTPNTALKENTSYTLEIDGVKTVLGEDFLPFTATFATGLNPGGSSGDAAFIKTDTQVSAGAYSSLVISPDGTKLYATTLGVIPGSPSLVRWDIDPATGSLSNERVFTDPLLEGRAIIGIAFDPSDPDVLWVSNNDSLGTANAADFSGRISRITLDDGPGFTGTVQDYVVGLPRSVRDHLTNSIAFHPDPISGEQRLYIMQGSNSAMGAPDNAWGNRPERLLSAAVLELDTTRDVSAGPINVQTQDPNVVLPPGAGAQVGYYNPFASDAALKLYATGVRNAYDLVWHSNGHLYVAANGSAAGGNTPDNPNTPQNEAILGVGTQDDFLFDVRGGFYYGHPNPLRSEYILNGGNPTTGLDPNEVVEYPVGVRPPANYGGTAYDFSRNRSPNGSAEYLADVFGGALKNGLLVTEYSGGNDIVVLKFDAQGRVIQDEVSALVDAQGNTITFADPLDVVADAATGRIYVISLADGKISLLTPTSRDPTPPTDIAYQAEDAVLVGGRILDTQPNFHGTGFVDFGDRVSAGESITWTFDVAKAGVYRVGFRYALAATEKDIDGRPLSFTVNGRFEDTLQFLPVGRNFREWDFEYREVALQVGSNTVSVASISKSGANIDELTISPTPLQELNTRPEISGSQANLSFAQGAPVAFVLRNVLINDVDPGDDASYVARLKGGGDLPSWLAFEGPTQTFSSTSPPPPGVYEIEIVADDGQDESVGRVSFAIEIVRQVNAADIDRDGLANAADTDDDGDGVADTKDPFQSDPSNGLATPVTEGRKLVFDFSGRPFGADPGFNGFGITGFHLSGNRTPEQLGLGSPNLTIANGVLHIENAGAGDLPSNDLIYGAQFGIDPLARRINISATFDHPFDTRAPARGMNFGLLIGTGDNENYVKLVLEGKDAAGAFLQLEVKENGVRIDANSPSVGRTNAGIYRTADADDTVTFAFDLDTVTGTLTARWSLRNGADLITGSLAPIVLHGDLLKAVQGDYTLPVNANNSIESGLSVGIVASSRGAGVPLDVDVLDITVEGLVTDPDVTLVNKISAALGAHGAFSYIQNPTANNGAGNPPREYHDREVITIRNDGNDVLNVTGIELTGPFKFLDLTDSNPFTLDIGGSRDIEIGFDSSPTVYDPEEDPRLFKGELNVFSDDPDESVATASLAGYWQPEPENNQEPDFNELMELYGFGTRADQNLFDNFDLYQKAGADEVLSPYWKLAAGYTSASVVQLAAYHDITQSALFIYGPGDNVGPNSVTIQNQSVNWNQSVLPLQFNGTQSVGTINNDKIVDSWIGDEVFGIRVSAVFSDPRLNDDGPGRGPPGEQRGHFIRIYQAYDDEHNVIADTYIVGMDYSGINYDYQDNVYLIRGITPATEFMIA